jgi:hypothetical protein
MEIRISQNKAAEMSAVQQAGETALLTRLEALQVCVLVGKGSFANNRAFNLLKQEQSRRMREKDNMGKEVETPAKVFCRCCSFPCFFPLKVLCKQRKVREAEERKKVCFTW